MGLLRWKVTGLSCSCRPHIRWVEVHTATTQSDLPSQLHVILLIEQVPCQMPMPKTAMD